MGCAHSEERERHQGPCYAQEGTQLTINQESVLTRNSIFASHLVFSLLASRTLTKFLLFKPCKLGYLIVTAQVDECGRFL